MLNAVELYTPPPQKKKKKKKKKIYTQYNLSFFSYITNDVTISFTSIQRPVILIPNQYITIQLMHSIEVNIRICQHENSDVYRGEAEVNITFEGWLILMLTEKECTNCFVIWHCLSFIFIFINLLKEDNFNNILPKFLQLLWDKQNNCILIHICLASFLLDIGK